MEIFNYLYLHIFLGIAISLLILAYPLIYVESLKQAVVILKTASLKLKAKDQKKPLNQEILKQQQDQYVQEFNKKIEKDSNHIQKSPIRFNFTLVFMILGWPFIAFIYVLAFLLKTFYLDSQDLPK